MVPGKILEKSKTSVFVNYYCQASNVLLTGWEEKGVLIRCKRCLLSHSN